MTLTPKQDLIYSLGKVAGLLSRPDVRAELVQSLRGETLAPAYIERVRELLAQALSEARAPEGPLQ